MCTWMILQLSVYAMQCRRIKVHLIIFDAFEFQFTHETYQLNNHSFIHLSLSLTKKQTHIYSNELRMSILQMPIWCLLKKNI